MNDGVEPTQVEAEPAQELGSTSEARAGDHPIEQAVSRSGGNRRLKWIWPTMQVVVTAGLLYWVFSDPALLKQMAKTLGRADPWWLAGGLGLGPLWIGASVWRWHIYLRVHEIDLSRRRAGCIYLISMFFMLVLPGAVGGDAVRIVYLIRHDSQKKTGAVLSVIMDHLAGLIALIVLAGLLTFSRFEWFTQSPITQGTLIFLLVFLGGSLLALAAAFVGVETGLTNTLPQHVPGRAKLIEFAQAFTRFIRAWRASLKAVGLSFIVLLGYFTTFYCAARAFDAAVSLGDMLSIMPVVDVISGLPLTVSGLGVREKLFETLLHTLADVPRDVALLTSLSGFFFIVFWSLVGALIFPFYRGRRAAG